MGDRQAVGPTPDGSALTVVVDCRTDAHADDGAPHPVTIGGDWSLETPHDLEAERVAAAFGGFCSCVELADRMIPALREAAELITRRALVPVDRRASRMWLVRNPPTRCVCASLRFTSVQMASRHVRGAVHLAAKYDVSFDRLSPLIGQLHASHGTRVPASERTTEALVLESDGLDDLWDAGVHPELVRQAAALVTQVDEPLPVWFHLGAVFGPVDDRMRELLAECTSPQVAAWLIWSDATRTARSARLTAEWLRTDVPRGELETLVRHRVTVDAAEALADATERTLRQAAAELAAWAAADCFPTPDELALLDRFGLRLTPRPSGAALDAAEEQVASLVPRERRPSRSELGVMVALAGGVRPATALVVRGARTVHDMAAVVAGEDTRMEAG